MLCVVVCAHILTTAFFLLLNVSTVNNHWWNHIQKFHGFIQSSACSYRNEQQSAFHFLVHIVSVHRSIHFFLISILPLFWLLFTTFYLYCVFATSRFSFIFNSFLLCHLNRRVMYFWIIWSHEQQRMLFFSLLQLSRSVTLSFVYRVQQIVFNFILFFCSLLVLWKFHDWYSRMENCFFFRNWSVVNDDSMTAKWKYFFCLDFCVRHAFIDKSIWVFSSQFQFSCNKLSSRLELTENRKCIGELFDQLVIQPLKHCGANWHLVTVSISFFKSTLASSVNKLIVLFSSNKRSCYTP